MFFRVQLALVCLVPACAWADRRPPADFAWVEFKNDPETLARVTRILRAEPYSAIREIGVRGDAALVFTTLRDGWDTPDGDRTDIYSVSLRAGTARHLLSGYSLKIVGWLDFHSAGADLGITYSDCIECEPAILFTALACDSGQWRARWKEKGSKLTPGAAVMVTDAGEPYTDEEVDQVWAILRAERGPVVLGTFWTSRHRVTGKRDSMTRKYTVDAKTGADRALTLTAAEARAWQREICRAGGLLRGVSSGQDSKTCKRLRAGK